MIRLSRSIPRAVIAAGVTLFLGLSPANAALIHESFSGKDCGGMGGFANCFAGVGGTQQGDGVGLSPAIYKLEKGGGEDFGDFPSISGDEFTLDFDPTTHVLSWNYTPDPDDPLVRYFSVKQGNGFTLFRNDDNSPIYAYSGDIEAVLGYNDFSHVTWFDTGTVVPLPAALPLLLTALAGLGFVARRRWRTT